MDYTLEMSKGILNATRIENDNMLSRMEYESELIVSCLEFSATVLDLQVMREAVGEKDGFIKSIKDFFKKIFNMFLDKLKSFVDKDGTWLRENEEALLKMDLTGFKISLIPYWNVSLDGVKSFFSETLNDLFKKINKPFTKAMVNGASDNKVEFKFEPLKKFITKDENIAEGYKNYLRHGSIDAPKHIEISDGKLKDVLKDAISYCKSYEKTVVPYIKSQLSYVDNEIKKVEDKLKSVKENMVMIENTHILNSDLRLLPLIETVVMEADAKNNKEPGKTTVKIDRPEKDENSEDKKDEDGNNIKGTDYNKHSKAELRYINNGLAHSKIILTSGMTVLEEKYVAYMNLLRGLKPKSNKSDNEAIKIKTSEK